MMSFIVHQPHPETNETACTWLLPDAAPLKPLWKEAVTACAGVCFNGKVWYAAAFREDEQNTRLYFESKGKPEAGAEENALCEDKHFSSASPVRHISLFVWKQRLMLGVQTDALRIYDALSGQREGELHSDCAQAALCVIGDKLYLAENEKITELDRHFARSGSILSIHAASTADYSYGTRKDAPELYGAGPGTGAGLFSAYHHVFYVCNDRFDRCGTLHHDACVCHATQLDGQFSRRYLVVPSADCQCIFTDDAGRTHALIIGTENSVCPGQAAAVALEWAEGDFLRPQRNQITERACTAAMRPLPFTDEIRDSFVYNAPDGWYYLTGTTKRNGGAYWSWTNGIHLWRTKDFSQFEDLGIVYDYAMDRNSWQLQASARANTWAPEIVYHEGTFWLTYSTTPGCGLLRSVSGLAQGPYQDMGRVVMKGIDSGFFVDGEQLYLVWQNGRIAPFNSGCTTFTEEPRLLLPEDGQQVGYEGAGIIRVNGKYVLYAAEWNGDKRIDGTYDMMYSVSDSLYGPYSPRRVLVPHGGHGSLFYNKQGELCFSMFGNDRTAAFRHGFGVGHVKVTENQDGLILEACP